MDQSSEEWFAARLGKVTASRLSDVLATIKTGEAAARANYRIELVAERLTGKSTPGFTSAAMQWGVECEPMARSEYETETGLIVTEVGFVDHPTIAMAGASPDGLVGDDGLIEIKCPETKTHIETLTSKKAPSKYIPQMQWQMACTGRQWVDFVSFDPRLPEHLMLEIIRVDRDQLLIDQYSEAVSIFLAEVSKTVELLNSRSSKC
jgi:putative phage-type endonuclease